MNKIWKLKSLDFDTEELSRLAEIHHLSEKGIKLLFEQGIDTQEKLKRFLCPSLADIHDPFLMKNMDVAVSRLQRAIEQEERVLVYGDYDVDGTTAVSLVYIFLGQLGVDLGIYIPERYGEGYGISEQGVQYASENGFSLVIALDCGIKAYPQIELANSLGVDFIICDHHFAEESIPRACAVLDPKQPGCTYPCKYLSGAGVGFKLLQGLSLRMGYPIHHLLQHLDLLAISIAADLVEIMDENRIFAYYGLKRLNENPSPGIKALKQVVGIGTRKVDVQDIVFRLGPRINAAGRMMNGSVAVELFTSPDSETAELYAQIVNSSNIKRQGIDRQMTNEALQMMRSDVGLETRKSTVLFNPNWHKGIVGIVASRLVDIYYRPTVILTESDGIVSGSARSVRNFDIYEAISQCSSLLDSYGGHTQAVGLTMCKENIELFRERFEEVVASTMLCAIERPTIEIDMELAFPDLNIAFFQELDLFAPYGPGNPAPIFALYNVPPDPYARSFGRMQEHLKFNIVDKERNKTWTAVAYQQSKLLSLVRQRAFHICFSVERNFFYTPATLQFNVKDILEA
ncbi:MAG: single-stranded-DNA-specific exonuclease RecJ [Bacteroides sp.]